MGFLVGVVVGAVLWAVFGDKVKAKATEVYAHVKDLVKW